MAATSVLWKPVPDWDGLYEVSSMGQIRSLSRVVQTQGKRNMTMRFKGKVLKPDIDKDGYHVYRLTAQDKRTAVKAHRAVMEAFVGPCPEGMQVAHNDGDKSKNFVDNLRYVTCLENHADKQKHGTTARGNKHGRSKITEEDVKRIRSSESPTLILADFYGLSETHIHRILNRESWTHV